MDTEDGRTRSGVTRRRVLARLGAGGAVGVSATAGCVDALGSGGDAVTTTGGDGAVRFGLSTADSGAYLDIGQEERRGFGLAIDHLNDGGGLVDESVFPELSGDGVLGRPVESETYDTGSEREQVSESLAARLADGQLAMFSGGISGGVVDRHRDLAHEHGVPYFAGTALLGSLTGENCSPYVYREQFTSDAVLQALAPYFASEFGDDVVYQQLFVDEPEGNDLVQATQSYFQRADSPEWVTEGVIQIRRGSTDMSRALESARDTEPDVLFCHVFGLDAVNVLDQAADVLPDDVSLVFPWLNQAIGNSVEALLRDVLGTTTWDPGFTSWRSKTFAESYREAYVTQEGVQAQTATGPAHLIYGQTLTYAAGVERAGTFDPDAVRSELEGIGYNMGLGDEEILACNHQSTRPVPVVRGRAEPSDGNSWFDVLSVEEAAEADCDEPPASECSF